jgi:hypothetical protein
MRSEVDVPMAQRFLPVEGHLSAKAKKALRKGLPKQLSENMRLCFTSFAYADLILPREFDTLFHYNREEIFVRRGEEKDIVFQPEHLATATFTCCRIVASTQQYAVAWQEIPEGMKAVCVIEFPDGVPSILDALPVVNAWYESREAVALCNRDTLHAIQENGGMLER